jgi:hypothetical protein
MTTSELDLATFTVTCESVPRSRSFSASGMSIRAWDLGHHILDDMPMHIGEAAFEAVVVEGEALVIKAH